MERGITPARSIHSPNHPPRRMSRDQAAETTVKDGWRERRLVLMLLPRARQPRAPKTGPRRLDLELQSVDKVAEISMNHGAIRVTDLHPVENSV